MSKPNGVILYEGPSVLTGEPIVCIITGIHKPSENPKTGPMLQTWILRQDKPPTDAVKDGSDVAICGDCPLRAQLDQGRRCYVNVGNAPLGVWKSYKAGILGGGNYGRLSTSRDETRMQLRAIGEGGRIRMGAYGDPAAVPVWVWIALTGDCLGWTGYTHQWRHQRFDQHMLAFCMASVETDADIAELNRLHPGARYFRVRLPGEPRAQGEMQCPASAEAGKRLDCYRCGACNGGAQGRSVSIEAHGSKAITNQWGK